MATIEASKKPYWDPNRCPGCGGFPSLALASPVVIDHAKNCPYKGMTKEEMNRERIRQTERR